MPTGKSGSITLLFCISALLLVISPAAADNTLSWHWQHAFTSDKQREIKTWLKQVDSAVSEVFGEFPFPVHLYLYRADKHTLLDMGEPVPWARTLREGNKQSLQFYIDTDYSLKKLLADWTAPHEFAHLIFPYLGKEHSWLAEGFASYLQFVVMEQMGVIDRYTRKQRTIERIQNAEKGYYANPALQALPASDLRSFAHAGPLLKSSGDSPTLYWGGAIFFLQLDAKLQNRGGLAAVLKRYLKCCRLKQVDAEQLMVQLDRLSFSQHFTETYQEFQTRIGFPEYRKFFALLYGDSEN